MILFPSSIAYLQRNEHYYARSCLARIMRIEKVTKLTIYSFVLYIIILYDFMFYHQANSRCKNFARNITGITYSSYNIKEILKCLPWWWKTTASTFQNIHGTLNTTYNGSSAKHNMPGYWCWLWQLFQDFNARPSIYLKDLLIFLQNNCEYMWSRCKLQNTSYFLVTITF